MFDSLYFFSDCVSLSWIHSGPQQKIFEERVHGPLVELVSVYHCVIDLELVWNQFGI